MKIFRYPKSNSNLLEEVDSFRIENKLKLKLAEISDSNDKVEACLDCNITIDKRAERESRIRIELDRVDIEYIHQEYERILKLEQTQKDEYINNLENQIEWNRSVWQGFQNKIVLNKVKKVPDNVFSNYKKRIIDSMANGYYDRVGSSDLSVNKISFNQVFGTAQKYELHDILELIKLSNNYFPHGFDKTLMSNGIYNFNIKTIDTVKADDKIIVEIMESNQGRKFTVKDGVLIIAKEIMRQNGEYL